MPWKVIRSVVEIVNPGIFQEKLIVICDEETMKMRLLKRVKKNYPEAEVCEVPKNILDQYPHSFGYWVNKHDPQCSIKDIKEGNIRMFIY